MEHNKTCTNEQNHQDHICILQVKGLIKEAELLANNPAVKCFTCGEKANAVANICVPVSLDNKY